MKLTHILPLIPLLAAAPSQAASLLWKPVTLSPGLFNTDVVFENTTTPTVSGTFGARHFYENGLQTTGGNPGLNPGGKYSYNYGGAIGTAVYQFQPYSANNVILGNGTTFSFSPADQLNYSHLSLVAAVGNAAAGRTVNYSVTYTDATTDSGSFAVQDWGVAAVSPGVELLNVGRTNGITGMTLNPAGGDGNAWSLFSYLIDVNPNKTISSFTYNSAGSGELAVWALSGAAPEPGRASLALLAGLAFVGKRARRKTATRPV